MIFYGDKPLLGNRALTKCVIKPRKDGSVPVLQLLKSIQPEAYFCTVQVRSRMRVAPIVRPRQPEPSSPKNQARPDCRFFAHSRSAPISAPVF
eukprot:SAG11_NODE_1605_length_4593_cov_2.083667_8_plen_93_part_00